MIFSKNKKYFPIDFKDKNSIYYYFPYFLLISWLFFTFLSIFFIHYKVLFNGFTIFSVLYRIFAIVIGIYFFKQIFIEQKKNKKLFHIFKTYVGYSVVFTYVFYSFPRIVGEFYNLVGETFSLLSFLTAIINTIIVIILYFFLRTDQTRLVLNIFSKKDLDFEKRLKKDKKFRKAENKKINGERSFIEKLWFNWIDDFLQAIFTVMIINQFIFQMYQIPSESMVPTFLIQDRVVVNKAIYGFQLPLTKWKLPSPVKPKVGDIVVFLNPKTHDPDSDVQYKNVFARVFYPFVFMMTLSLVDIDKKADGNPKERFIVKRMIAGEGEKICMLNDQVYKKTKTSDWKMMKNISGQREYGQADLYYEDNPHMQNQSITRELRSIFNEVIETVNSLSEEEIKQQLADEKKVFLEKLNQVRIDQFIKTIENHLIMNHVHYTEIYENLSNTSSDLFYINKLEQYRLLNKNKNQVRDDFKRELENYLYCVFYDKIKLFIQHLKKYQTQADYFESQINTRIKINKDDNPFEQFFMKLNAVYKINLIKFYQTLLSSYQQKTLAGYILYDQLNQSEQFNPALSFLYNCSIYLYGIPSVFIHFDERRKIVINKYFNYWVNTFGSRNLPEYPQGKDQFIAQNEIMVMGDNRYNSFDTRFGEYARQISLDKNDTGDLALKAAVRWNPYTIQSSYILGKAGAIFYPFNRVGLLK